MSRSSVTRVVLLSGLLLAAPHVGTARASAPPVVLPPFCELGALGSAQILVCVPPGATDLVVFAHGYVAPSEGPPQIPWSQLFLPDGTSIPEAVLGQGFAFATTSYSDDGLAVLDGVEDVRALVEYATAASPVSLEHVYLVGASEGGLVTTLAVEQYPLVFSGGVATCGPIGDFRKQINYWGDFRVLFDYYFPPARFPDLIPGTFPGPPCGAGCSGQPPVTEEEWQSVYVGRIAGALVSHGDRLDTILRVSGAPFGPDPSTKVETALGILWYSVFATQDARKKLGGQPYDNSRRLYLGSGSDLLLNLRIPRYHADVPALVAMEEYQTTGRLESDLVTMHTTRDPIVPYAHEPLYTLKTLRSGSALRRVNIPIPRYGHCAFTRDEALFALGVLNLKVKGLR